MPDTFEHSQGRDPRHRASTRSAMTGRPGLCSGRRCEPGGGGAARALPSGRAKHRDELWPASQHRQTHSLWLRIRA
eukprot:4728599-Pyramimonas_sp.AAC.1